MKVPEFVGLSKTTLLCLVDQNNNNNHNNNNESVLCLIRQGKSIKVVRNIFTCFVVA